jgi:glycosyltransferase involved in cell wall biosynthesis
VSALLLLTGEFPPRHGGIGTLALGLAEAAQRDGHDVTVSAPLCADSAPDEFPFAVERYAPGPDWRVRPALLRRVWKIATRQPWDIIHALDTPHARALGALNLLRRIPYIATVHGDELLACRGLKRDAWRALGVYRTADKIVCNSRYTEALLRDGGFVAPSMPTVVSYCGVSEFWFESEPVDIRTALGLPQDRQIILTVARLDERKGHGLVLEALERLPETQQRDLAYVVVGPDVDPSFATNLRARAAASPVPVIFTGPLPDRSVRALYAAAAVFCMPNEAHRDRVEGFGQAFLEAGAQGIPSVAARLGGIPEAVIDGATGLLTPPGDAAALAHALEMILRHPDLRQRLGAAARAHAQRMSFERCMRLTYGFSPSRQDAGLFSVSA